MSNQSFYGDMKDAIDGPPSNAGISSGPSSHVRVCATLKNLSSELRELVTALQTFQTQQPSIEMETIVSELTWQLDNATQLVQGLKTYPEVYRTMSATYIRTQCQRVCRSIGEGIEHAVIPMQGSNSNGLFPDGIVNRLRDTGSAFRRTEYPLRREDIDIQQKTKHWASQVINNQMNQKEGLELIRGYLESVLGKDRLKKDWGKVSTFFLHDIYNAHGRGDAEEEHYLRLLFWALNGVNTPPPEYLCPISLSVMDDPVVLLESEVTYERQNITTWMIEDENKTCPVSQKKINSVVLIENASLKAAIATWKREQISYNGDLISTYARSEDFGHEQAYHPEIDALDSFDGDLNGPAEPLSHLSAMPTSPRREPYMSAIEAMQYRDLNGLRRYDRKGSSDAMSGGSSNTSRIQRQIMTKEIASQMFAAASEGSLDILKEIYDKEWDLTQFDDQGRNPLHVACSHGRKDVVRFLLNHGLSPNQPTLEDESTPLILAATSNHHRIVEMLLEHGADLVAQDKRGWTALHCACDLGHRSVIQSLVRAGELGGFQYLDKKTKSGWSVLHCAARKGDLDVFKFLLRFRCIINDQCELGWTPLHIAVEQKHFDIVEEIVSHKTADINAKSKEGWTALHSAVDADDTRIGHLLISKGIDVNATSHTGYTALHRAAYYNKIEFGKLLVEFGKASLGIRTKSGRTAKDITSEQGHNEFHRYLFGRAVKNLFKAKK